MIAAMYRLSVHRFFFEIITYITILEDSNLTQLPDFKHTIYNKQKGE